MSVTRIALVTLHCDHREHDGPGGACMAQETYGGVADFKAAWDAAQRAGWRYGGQITQPRAREGYESALCPKHSGARSHE